MLLLFQLYSSILSLVYLTKVSFIFKYILVFVPLFFLHVIKKLVQLYVIFGGVAGVNNFIV